MQVKIVNVSSSAAWYRYKMGEVFEVADEWPKYFITPRLPGIPPRMILKKDCITVKQNNNGKK